MRRILAFAAALLILLCLCAPALAASAASSVQVEAVLNRDGSVNMTVAATLRLEQSGEVTFPLPAAARSVTLNGTGASSRQKGDRIYVKLGDITGVSTGSYSILLRYVLPNCVKYNEAGRPELTLPMLSGFEYPIESFEFTVQVPDEIGYKPAFFSGYHQQSIETDLSFATAGDRVSGYSTAVLKDHETFHMTLELSEKTFPRSAVELWSAGTLDMLCFICMGLAAAYWLFFLRCAPLLRRRSVQPPDGYSAGQLRSILLGQGADLTMMVLSWAQLGYILIRRKETGRVTLYKRMDMGNERSAFEAKVFRSLFGRSTAVDGTGYNYARLCRKVAAARMGMGSLFRPTSGSVTVLRVLSSAAGLFGGASLGIALVGDAPLGILVVILLAIAGAAASWFIHPWVGGLHLRATGSLLLALGLCTAWMVLGNFAGQLGMAAGVVGFQLLSGLAGFYGGRRTPTGRHLAGQVLGYRAYLKKLSPDELQRIRSEEPDFFYTAAPYALALGVDRELARQLGRRRLPPCPWLMIPANGPMTAAEWTVELRRTASALDEHQKRLPFEQLMGR